MTAKAVKADSREASAFVGISTGRAAGAGETRPAFTATSLPDLLSMAANQEWVVEGLVEARTLNVMFGDEGTRKSFLALDMGLSVASGIDWCGRRVTPGRVLYLAGEGKAGLTRRAKGWLIRRELDATPDLFLGDRFVALVDPIEADEVTGWLQDMNKGDAFVLVIVDTVARALAGTPENASEGMGALIENLDRMRGLTGATLMGVHHTPLEVRNGKGKPRPRGHSSLPAAADGLLAVEFDEDTGIATLTPIKLKDGATGDQLRFTFDLVEIGATDNFGNSITTLVPARTDEKPRPKRGGLGKHQRLALRLLSEASGATTRADLVRTMVDAGAPKSRAHEAISSLLADNLLRNDHGLLSLA